MHKEAQAEPRTCYRCQRAQPLTEFYVEAEKRRAATLGRRTFTYPCRSCQSELAAERMAPRRAIVDAARAAGCTDCGLIDLEHPEIPSPVNAECELDKVGWWTEADQRPVALASYKTGECGYSGRLPSDEAEAVTRMWNVLKMLGRAN